MQMSPLPRELHLHSLESRPPATTDNPPPNARDGIHAPPRRRDGKHLIRPRPRPAPPAASKRAVRPARGRIPTTSPPTAHDPRANPPHVAEPGPVDPRLCTRPGGLLPHRPDTLRPALASGAGGASVGRAPISDTTGEPGRRSERWHDDDDDDDDNDDDDRRGAAAAAARKESHRRQGAPKRELADSDIGIISRSCRGRGEESRTKHAVRGRSARVRGEERVHGSGGPGWGGGAGMGSVARVGG